eukprot:m.69713 g.69713  ORF g.69713 m.69713 type:complete len:50 (-) comp11642_c0_seq1:2162-2311(-)
MGFSSINFINALLFIDSFLFQQQCPMMRKTCQCSRMERAPLFSSERDGR